MENNLISIFNKVRDIPYKIPTSVGEKDCCCSGKHIVLKKQFEKLGYECKYRVCSFKWSDLNLPSELYKVPHENNSTHVYLEIKINGKWNNVDATWDKGIYEILQVNEWDGESDTQIAVPVIKLFSHEESEKIMTDENPEVAIEDLKKNGKFYEAFNEWLANERKKIKEEYLDIVDENGNLTGEKELRSVVHEKGFWHRTAHIYFYRIVNGEIQLLPHLRSKLKSSSPNKWDTRFGGHVEAGQTLEETVIKEIFEETGLNISLSDLIVGPQGKYDGGANKEIIGQFYYNFEGEIEELKFNDGEVQKAQWMTIDEIRRSIENEPQNWTSGKVGFEMIVNDLETKIL